MSRNENQWIFSEAELANTPSIQDGLPPEEEAAQRAKGVNFILQVGILLSLPQLTLSTACIFFQRFLMRASLQKARDGIPKLHPYQSAGTALFLATKVEESSRKMRDLVQSCCRVATKSPNAIVDEQSKDYWRWRDTLLDTEDVLLEVLCFDLSIDSAHRQLFEMLKFYKLEHNKRLRNAAWAFVTDSINTQLCLLCSSRTIAGAALYAACRFCDVTIPLDDRERPWYAVQHIKVSELRRAIVYVTRSWAAAANKPDAPTQEVEESIYKDLVPPSPGLNGREEGELEE
ncbi:hypothetical protein AMS68_000381 [Peltaster fructicola]|uniref:RNA polymerase II holoenzyme cyclin-like subunit n=1 Tax=Peltaster fructicola TaxID=286661 RepID=A0A6H0XJH3_9PEZI|nr:hypothetical protein AMS68_000381 [Peltaster fructicola]